MERRMGGHSIISANRKYSHTPVNKTQIAISTGLCHAIWEIMKTR